jgi:uncharacterized protein YbjT (DUF2867 family)
VDHLVYEWRRVMNELITVAGVTGRLGKHLGAVLPDLGYQVRGIVQPRARAERPSLVHGSCKVAVRLGDLLGMCS